MRAFLCLFALLLQYRYNLLVGGQKLALLTNWSNVMMHSQYLRIQSKAGSVFCTPKEFIKAAHSVLNKKGKSSQMRKERHLWLRSGLKQMSEQKGIYLYHRF